MIETTASCLHIALRAVRPAVAKRPIIPILGCVKLLDAKVTAFDLDMEIEVDLPLSKANRKAPIIIDYCALAGLVGCIDPDETVRLNRHGALSFNGARYGIPVLPAEDFPDWNAPASTRRVCTGNNDLAAAMRAVQFAISTEPCRYYLNGVSFVTRNDIQFACATDGHRLAMWPLAARIEWLDGMIIPANAVRTITALRAEPVAISGDETRRQITFDFPGLRLRTNLIDGIYPSLDKIVSPDVEPAITVDRMALRSALLRLSAATGQRRYATKIEMLGEKIVLSTRIGNVTGSEILAAEGHVAGAVGFNRRYLTEICDALRSAKRLTVFRPKGAKEFEPMQIRDADAPGAGFVILMPMRVD